MEATLWGGSAVKGKRRILAGAPEKWLRAYLFLSYILVIIKVIYAR